MKRICKTSRFECSLVRSNKKNRTVTIKKHFYSDDFSSVLVFDVGFDFDYYITNNNATANDWLRLMSCGPIGVSYVCSCNLD